MSVLKNLMEYALKFFYPLQKTIIDDEGLKTYYPLKEDFNNRLNSKYVNGKWYLNQSIPPFIITIERNIKPMTCFYIIHNLNNYSFAFAVEGFRDNQGMNVTAVFDEDLMENTYTARLFDTKSGYMFVTFNDNINWDNLKQICISAEEMISNHIKYTGVNEIIINNPQSLLMPISREDFSNIKNDTNIVCQRILYDVQCMNYKNSDTDYGLRLRNLLNTLFKDDGHQKLKVSFNNINETIPLNNPVLINDSHKIHWKDDKLTIDGLSERPEENVEINIELTPYKQYTGFKAKITFENINGNSYTNATSIEYQV